MNPSTNYPTTTPPEPMPYDSATLRAEFLEIYDSLEEPQRANMRKLIHGLAHKKIELLREVANDAHTSEKARAMIHTLADQLQQEAQA